MTLKLVWFLTGVLSLIVVRMYMINKFKRRRLYPKSKEDVSILIFLGSGGHTTEMLELLRSIDLYKFKIRYYYVSSDDGLSISKAKEYESSRSASGWSVKIIPRARKVGQSWISTVFTTMTSQCAVARLLLKDDPDIVLCNGPGTCVPIAIASSALRIICLRRTRLIFVESFARVKTLSLTGRILIHMADRFIVRWPELLARYPKAELAEIFWK